MTLRQKTFGIISLILLVLIGTLYLTARSIVLEEFSALEEQETRQGMARVLSAAEDDLAGLDATTRDWAWWDDTYRFIEDGNAEYRASNLLLNTPLDSNRLSVMVFVHASGRVVSAKGYDLAADQEVPIPAGLQPHLAPGSRLLQHSGPDSTVMGLLSLPEGPLLVAAEPILTSARRGPARGTLIFGRFLDPREVQRLSRTTLFSLTAYQTTDPQVPAELRALLPALEAGALMTTHVRDDQTITGYALSKDIYDQPALVWRADMPRAIYARGRATMLYALGGLLLVGIVFIVAVLLLIEKLVLSRLARLNTTVSGIGMSRDFARRAPVGGRDELGTLAGTINTMLDAVEQAQAERRESEERYRQMFEKNGAIKLVIDPTSGLIVDANPAAFEFYGYPPGGLLALRLTALDTAPPEAVAAALARASGEQESYFRSHHKLASGEVRDVELYTSPVEVRGRRLLYAIIHDITERQRAQQLIQRHAERLAALRSIDTAISGSLDLAVTLDIILEQTRTQLEVDAADVLLFDPQGQTLRYAAGRGFRTPGSENTWLRLGESAARCSALEQHIVSLPALTTGPGFPAPAGPGEEPFAAFYAVPLIAKGEVKGVLEVFHRTPLHPDPEWLDFLEAVAGQAAIAIDNATLFQDLQHSNEELARAYDSTLEGWSRALDLRDKETEGHSRRVTELTLRLAQAMGVSDAELIHMRRGALLHDIGKMGIPDRILLKPGPLTDEEWTIMQRHPAYAYELLAPIPFLRPALDIPYCHHERWDGLGYPRGLRGTEIPLAARIFAVVDVWDALTSDRPYRKAWRENKVRTHIHALAGTHFDPEVVAVFLRLLPGSYDLSALQPPEVPAQLIA